MINIKNFLKKILILDQDRYKGKMLNSYIRLEQNIQQLDEIDSVIMNMVNTIPKEIELLNFKYYFINFNTSYFDALYLYCLIVMMIAFPFAMAFHPFLIFALPLLYCFICMICNFILTIHEINQLKKTLQEIYESIQMKL